MASKTHPCNHGDMHLIITGIGDAFSAIHHGSSGVVKVGNRLVAIDCPGSIMAMYREASVRSGLPLNVDQIDDYLLTHLHGDHSNGLETIGFARRYLCERPTRPRLHALPEVLDRVWEKLAPAMDGRTREGGETSRLEDYFEPCPLDPDQPALVAGLTVRCRRTRHSVPTAGLLISDGVGTLGWSSDTEFEQTHIDWLSEASVIVHECGGHFKHTTWAELDQLPDDLKRRTWLIHLPDGTDVPEGLLRPLDEGSVIEIAS